MAQQWVDVIPNFATVKSLEDTMLTDKRKTARLLVSALLLGASACGGIDSETEASSSELGERKSLGMTDVTILYPLGQPEAMLPLTLSGPQGALLPAPAAARLSDLDAPQDASRNVRYKLFASLGAPAVQRMRIVGVRLDPCFGYTGRVDSYNCRNTIRLIAQPLTIPGEAVSGCIGGDGKRVDGRASLHLIYDVSRAVFVRLLENLRELRIRSGLPLQRELNGAHPTLRSEGLAGPYATGLRELVLGVAGEKTLRGIAFSVQDRGQSEGCVAYDDGAGVRRTDLEPRWVFGGFDYRSGALSTMRVGVAGYEGFQTFDLGGSGRPRALATPSTDTLDRLLTYWNPPSSASPEDFLRRMDEGKRTATQLQNPTHTSALTTDCLSCHVAKQAHADVGRDPAFAYQSSRYALSNTDAPGARSAVRGAFRMFGYTTNATPIISARVVHETASVLDDLNGRLLR